MIPKKWSWPNEAKTAIVRTELNGGPDMFLVDGILTNEHPEARLLASGSLPHIYTPEGQYETYTDPIVYTIEINHIDKEITPWTQQQIDDKLAADQLDLDIAKAILDGSISTLTYDAMEAAIVGETSLMKKNTRVTWALMKERNKNIV